MPLAARRVLALVAVVAVPVLLVRFGGHAGVHAARNLLIPGAGMIDHFPFLGVAFVAVGVVATVLWLRWGADWAVLAAVATSMVVSYVLTADGGDGHVHVHEAIAGTPPLAPAAHEFPLVVLVVGALAWLRAVLGRTPGVRRLVGRRHRARSGAADLPSLGPVDRCRAAAIATLAAGPDAAMEGAVDAPDVVARARRVGIVARARVGGDPFRRDHAHARAARTLVGLAAVDERERLAADAAAAPLGVPCSEPGWVRPLDATLTVLALDQAGRPEAAARWATAFDGAFRLRRGHRPAWWWTPLGIGAGAMPAWEHAATSAIARAAGWIDHDDDWGALRRRALGAAARGGDQPDDERCIAATRLWLTLVDDPEAERIVMRPTVRRDPLACALDALAGRLRAEPSLLRDHRPHALPHDLPDDRSVTA